MTLRRLAALVTSAAMLHLAAAAGAAACPPHGTNGHHASTSHDEAGASGATSSNGHAMPMPAPARGSVQAHGTRAGAPPCEIPTQQHCCDTVAGCGVDSAVAGERPDLTSSAFATSRIREPLDDVPASFAPALEPPPPKA